jgi:thioredoxin 1
MKNITKENWADTAEKGLVLVEFGATWCAPCRAMEPILAKLQDEIPHVEVLKVDIDADQELAEEWGVMSVPTMILLKDGETLWKDTGAKPLGALVAKIAPHV